jgi:molybdopterin molybdotransferase
MATIGTRAKRAPLTPLEDARELVLGAARPLPGEEVGLGEALGRTLAADVRSPDDVPGFDNSAMDGYAVRAADTAGTSESDPVELRLIDESRAGRPAEIALGPSEAIRISTGAVIPAGADSVLRLEEAAEASGRVSALAEVAAGQEIRRAGDDIRAGEVVLRAGAVLGPAELGVLASVGVPRAACARRPRASVLTTGEELIGPGDEPFPGAVRNSNAETVPAQALLAGCELAEVAVVGDDPDATTEAVRRGLEDAELLAVCGGVSVGVHDHVKAALAALGVTEVFWGVALRPGRPTWFGYRDRPDGGRTLVFGLPGNPVSAMVTFHLFARPAAAAMLGRPEARGRLSARLAERYEKRPGRTHAVRCRLELTDEGWSARPTGPQASHILTSMLGADGLAVIPAESGSIDAGAIVEVEPFSFSGPSPGAIPAPTPSDPRR